jgi:predicted DNA-binding ribbon-helix-helix protein
MKSIAFTVEIQVDRPVGVPAKKATARSLTEVKALACQSTNLSGSGESTNSNLHSALRICCKQWVRYGSNCFLRDTTSLSSNIPGSTFG